jgi:pseudouridine-5'-phosphate glycosidase
MELVQILKAQHELGIESALLVTVPVPEAAEVANDILANILDEALAEAERLRIGGRELTPLSRMAQQSEGATLQANVALLENNARVAAEIAIALS